MDKLSEDITEILVKTTYHADYGSGETAIQIQNWERRAIIKYQNDRKFHVVIDKQVSLIMTAIERYKDREKHEMKALENKGS